LSKNLHETQTICHLYLTTIGQAAKGLLHSLAGRDALVFKISQRSLFEYVLDLALVGYRNDVDFNRRFAFYHKLTLYLKRDIVDTYRWAIPRAHRDYFTALVSTFQDILVADSTNTSGLIIPDFKKAEKRARQFIVRGWTGLAFDDKLKTVLVELSCGYKRFPDPVKKWKDVDESLCKCDQDQWAESSFLDKAEAILKHIQTELSIPSNGMDSIDPILTMLHMGFKFGSEFTHPTPRGVVPNLDLEKDTFDLFYEYDNTTLIEAEQLLYLLYSSAVAFASAALPVEEGCTLREQFEEWSKKKPNINNWVMSH